MAIECAIFELSFIDSTSCMGSFALAILLAIEHPTSVAAIVAYNIFLLLVYKYGIGMGRPSFDDCSFDESLSFDDCNFDDIDSLSFDDREATSFPLTFLDTAIWMGYFAVAMHSVIFELSFSDSTIWLG